MDNTSQKNLKNFIRHILFTAVGVFFAVCAWMLFYQVCLILVGEAITEKQLAIASRHDLLWLNKYYDGGVNKTGVARYRPLKVAVVGSSRVMQIRGRFFNKLTKDEFYNLGGDTKDMVDAYSNLLRLASSHPPELVIIGLDYGFFCGRDPADESALGEIQKGESTIIQRLKRPYSLLQYRKKKFLSYLQDKISIYKTAWRDPVFWQGLSVWSKRLGTHKIPEYGLTALIQHRGFRSDGSFQYDKFACARAERPSYDEVFKEPIITPDFNLCCGISKVELKWLYRYLNYCRQRNISVLGYLTPVSAPLYEKLALDPARREELRIMPVIFSQFFRAFGFSFIDYQDVTQFGGSQDDYYDKLHTTEMLSAKLVYDLATRLDTGPLLAPYLDAKKLSTDIRKSKSWHLVYEDEPTLLLDCVSAENK